MYGKVKQQISCSWFQKDNALKLNHLQICIYDMHIYIHIHILCAISWGIYDIIWKKKTYDRLDVKCSIMSIQYSAAINKDRNVYNIVSSC